MTQTPVSKPRSTAQAAEPEPKSRPRRRSAAQPTEVRPRRPRAVASPRQATTRAADPASTEPASVAPATAEPDSTEPVGTEPSRRRRRLIPVPAVLGVVTVVLGGLAAWFAVEANALTSTPAASNSALTDNAATTQVIGQATSAVNAIFSYNYADPGRPRAAAQRDLTGAAVGEYQRLYRAVQQDAAKAKQFVLTTTVTSAGVEMLNGSSARVLVFSNQVLTSSGAKAQSYDAMVALNLVSQHGTWKIDSIDTFSNHA